MLFYSYFIPEQLITSTNQRYCTNTADPLLHNALVSTLGNTGGCVCYSFFFFFPCHLLHFCYSFPLLARKQKYWKCIERPLAQTLDKLSCVDQKSEENGALWCLGKGKVVIASLPALFKSVVRQICRWAGNKRGLAVLESVDNLRREKAIGLSRGREGIPSKASVIKQALSIRQPSVWSALIVAHQTVRKRLSNNIPEDHTSRIVIRLGTENKRCRM